MTFADGAKTTAFPTDRKQNLQLTMQSEEARPLLQQVGQLLMQHPGVRNFAAPKKISRIMFSRYEPGMHYASHNDAAMFTGPGGEGRADLSFTIFLTDPETYEGGELVLESPIGEVVAKGPAGAAIFYDTGLTHRVNKLVTGERLAVVGWLESWVADPQARAILMELGDAIKAAAAIGNDSEETIRLRKIRSMLMRRWAK